jgi:hypothetical protein
MQAAVAVEVVLVAHLEVLEGRVVVALVVEMVLLR